METEITQLPTLDLRGGIFRLDDHPWPPGLSLEKPATLIVRLPAHTRTGSNARWGAGPQAQLALNEAPAAPLLRAIVRDLTWYPADTSDCPAGPLVDPREGNVGVDQVVVRGSATVNWQCRVVEPLPDPLGEIILGLADRIEDRKPDVVQGGLQVWRVPWVVPEDSPLLGIGAGSGNRRWYNHWVLGHGGFAYRVRDGVAWAIVHTLGYAAEGTMLLSPDHPSAPVEMGGWAYVLLRHPVPQRDGRAD